MTWDSQFRWRHTVGQSLWLVPLLGALAGAALAWGAEWVGSTLDMPAALTFTPSTASSVLSAILGAMIPGGGGASLFVKFKGDADVAARERERFIRFVSSIRWQQ